MGALKVCQQCGEEFEANGRDLRCRVCRFAPYGNPRNILTPADLPEIRRRLTAGRETLHSIARDFGVHRTTIHAIADNRSWRGVGVAQWKPVTGYEGRYEVSEYGDILSLIQGRRILRPTPTGAGYKICLSSSTGKRSFTSVHRVMLMAFSPIPNAHLYNAIPTDGNFLNTNLRNWSWVRSQGEKAGHATLTETQVREIKQRILNDPKLTYRAIAREYGVTLCAIGKIMTGRTWKHVA